MIGEIIPEAYDAFGRKTLRPDWRRKGIHPTFPIGRYFSQPLMVKCESLRDVRRFLTGCKWVSDPEQFDKEDYWQPPDDFERTKKGDCEDFALWTWRQLLALGYDARFVAGRHGRYGAGHAWVEFFEDGKCFLVEPQAKMVERIPRLSTLRYHPKLSIAWDGAKVAFYSHEERSHDPASNKFSFWLGNGWLFGESSGSGPFLGYQYFFIVGLERGWIEADL